MSSALGCLHFLFGVNICGAATCYGPISAPDRPHIDFTRETLGLCVLLGIDPQAFFCCVFAFGQHDSAVLNDLRCLASWVRFRSLLPLVIQ